MIEGKLLQSSSRFVDKPQEIKHFLKKNTHFSQKYLRISKKSSTFGGILEQGHCARMKTH